MTMILIYGLIVMLIVIGMNNANEVGEKISKDRIIEKDILMTFYTHDTSIESKLGECSFSSLLLKDLNNVSYENCFPIENTLKNKNILITNVSSGNYEICYDANYDLFISHKMNLGKSVVKNGSDDKLCVSKSYNKDFPIQLLTEVEGFFNLRNVLVAIPLVYEAYNPLSGLTERVTTFSSGGTTYLKSDFMMNNLSLFDLEFTSNDKIYVSSYNPNIVYRYHESAKIVDIFVKATLPQNDKQKLEKFVKLNANLFDVVNVSTSDGSLQILKK